MKLFALLAIRFYQRMISPYKGFCCAYAAYTGHASCSALGYRAIRRYGVVDGIAVLDARLAKCGVAYRRYRPQAPRALGSQAGFLDCSCDAGGCDSGGCEMPGGGSNGCLSNASNFCSGGCDCGSCDWNKKRNNGDEQYVVIPPNTTLR
jgi:putative component of membrane protein insertase Oxa1/YidC/SpoIIIJ protein YidD